MEKPKRPLSSYNLFYRFKRAKILEAHANGGDESTDTIHKLIMAVPGLEDYPAIDDESALSSPELKEHRRNVIRSALLDNLVPTETKRSHRKSHGAMNFLEMNKIMCASWKSIDEYSLSVFEELAEEGRGIYKERVAVYNELSPLSQKKVIKSVDMPPMTGGVMGMGMLRVETPPASVPQDVASFFMKKEVVSSHQVMNGQMTGTTADVQPSAFTTGKMTTSNNKDGDRPKRPLSSYNLFYRFKRFKILESHDKGDHSSETIKQLITAIPGLEAYPFLSTTDLEDGQLEGITLTDEMKEIRRNEIRTTLKDSLSPKTTRRTHRKPQGDMAFAEMTKLMSDSWKNIDEYSRSVFEELSKESRGIYLKRMSEYEDEKNDSSSSSSFFISSPEPPMKKIKTSHDDDTAMMLNMVQPNLVNNFSRTGGDGLVPLYAQGPDSPTCVASTFFGTEGVIPNMPLFSGVFEPVDDEFINNCVSNVPASKIESASSSSMNDFPLPFMDETKKYGADKSGEVTAGDFLQLIATLDCA